MDVNKLVELKNQIHNSMNQIDKIIEPELDRINKILSKPWDNLGITEKLRFISFLIHFNKSTPPQ